MPVFSQILHVQSKRVFGIIVLTSFGLNDQEQWVLLNATTPLGTLSMLNNIERGLAAQIKRE